MDNGLSDLRAAPDALGRAQRLEDAQGRYIEFAKNTFPRGLTLDGLKIVIDCANGAAYKVAPTVLWELGAEVVQIGVRPNGFNINDGCGSTSTKSMRDLVVAHNADIGIALDGDADRLIVSDERGQAIDGDQIMALIARTWHRTERLTGNGIVATVMSNLGLENFLRGMDVQMFRTKVGDRYVSEQMRQRGCNVGGEQSGHIILSDYTTTGDGLIAALQVLAVVATGNLPVSEACHLFEPMPQILKNVRYNGIDPLANDNVQKIIHDNEERLGTAGRLVIRRSGTEPLIRVMAEGADEVLVSNVVGNIVEALDQASR